MKKLFTNKKLLITLLIFLLLIVLAIGGWLLSSRNKPVSEQEFNQVVSDVNQLNGQANYEEVGAILSDQTQKKQTSEQAYQTYLMQAANYQNLGKAQEALDAFRNAERVSPTGLTFIVARGIADLSFAMRDYTTALEYYKKSIEIAKADDDFFNDTYIGGIERTISVLEDPAVTDPQTAFPAIDYSQIPPGVPPPPQ